MTTLEDILNKRPDLKLLSNSKLLSVLKDKGITKKQIDDHFNPKELTQIYAKPQRSIDFKITSPPRSFQIDIGLLPKYKKQNSGIDKFLIAVDITSRKAFAYPISNGTMNEVIEKYKKFIKHVSEPIHKVEGDDFFNNKDFKKINQQNNIIVSTHEAKSDHITPVGNRLGIVDRCIRTIKGLISKHMLSNDTARWTDKIHDIIMLYNDTPHSSLNNETPNDVFDDIDFCQKMYEGQKKRNESLNRAVKILIGDNARVMEEKKVFDKEKAPWSRQIYKVVDKIGYAYQLEDESGRVVKRLYRPGELFVIKGDVVTDRISDGARTKAEKHHKHEKRLMRSNLSPLDEKISKRVIKPPARYA